MRFHEKGGKLVVKPMPPSSRRCCECLRFGGGARRTGRVRGPEQAPGEREESATPFRDQLETLSRVAPGALACACSAGRPSRPAPSRPTRISSSRRIRPGRSRRPRSTRAISVLRHDLYSLRICRSTSRPNPAMKYLIRNPSRALYARPSRQSWPRPPLASSPGAHFRESRLREPPHRRRGRRGWRSGREPVYGSGLARWLACEH